MVKDIYEVIREDCMKNGDYIYENRIIYLVGIYGLKLLKKYDLLEDRQLGKGDKQVYFLRKFKDGDVND